MQLWRKSRLSLRRQACGCVEDDLAGRKARWLHELGGTLRDVKCGVVSHIEWRFLLKISLHIHLLPLHLPSGITSQLPLEAIITMSSWLPESHRLQLALTALASGCIAATAVIGLQNAKQWYSIHDLKGSIPDLASKHDVEKVRTYFTQ
jgi:hypothetical protein